MATAQVQVDSARARTLGPGNPPCHFAANLVAKAVAKGKVRPRATGQDGKEATLAKEIVSSDQVSGKLIPTALRVVSWNIWWRFGPWRERETVILSVLRDLAPDVVCLQEVWREAGEHQAQRLGDALGLNAVFDEASSTDGIGFGNAILSRWPVIGHDAVDLPNSPTEASGGGRRAMLAEIEGPRGRFDVICTHLCWRLHESRWRQEQIAALCSFVDGHANSGFPPIVCGDFNAIPSSDEIRMMTGETAVAVDGLFFHDAWAAAGDGGPGFTWNNTNAFSSRTLEPNRRIDYIFVGDPHRADGAGHVTECRVVGDTAVDGIHGSDHFGLLAEIRY